MSNENEPDAVTKPSKKRLFSYVCLANLSSFEVGVAMAWPSPMMPKLMSGEDSPLDSSLNSHEQGWMFSLLSLGAGIVALIAGPLTDRYGRKLPLFIASLSFAAAYVFFIFGNQLKHIYIGRLLQGSGTGFTMTVLPMYIGEVSTAENRGHVGSLLLVFTAFGTLYSYCIGPYTKYLFFQKACLCVPIFTIWAVYAIPESPHFLIQKKRRNDAHRSLQRLRGEQFSYIEEELDSIYQSNKAIKKTARGRCADIWNNKANRRALTIIVGLVIFQQCSGAAIIVINCQSILAEIGPGLDAAKATIIIGCLQVSSSIAFQMAVGRWNRKTLLTFSAAGMCLSHFVTGFLFFYGTHYGKVSHFTWLLVIAFVAFKFTYRLGFGPLPLILLSELFAPNVKSLAATIATELVWGLGCLIIRIYPLVAEQHTYYVFWACSFSCGSAICFIHYMVMETYDLTLNEIQARLGNVIVV